MKMNCLPPGTVAVERPPASALHAKRVRHAGEMPPNVVQSPAVATTARECLRCVRGRVMVVRWCGNVQRPAGMRWAEAQGSCGRG